MTAACGGGSSAPKFGVAAVVDYTAGLLAAIFAAYDLAWLIPVIPLVGLPPLVLVSFCANDPPNVPSFTQAEVDALLELQLGADFDSGVSKVKDLLLNAIWYDACECSSGVLVPFAPPAQPANSITTVFPRAPLTAPCVQADYNSTLPVVPFAGVSGWGNVDYLGRTGVTVRVVFTYQSVGATHSVVQARLRLEDITAGTFVANTAYQNVPMVDGSHLDFANVPPATRAEVEISNPGTTTDKYGVRYEVYCDFDVPGAERQPCCPPDPATAATLQHILDLVQSMQRHYAPFGYVRGPTHSSISGTGSISVSRLIGVDVEVLSWPIDKRVALGNPPYIKDLGWLSVSDPDGMIQERRLAQQDLTWFPQLAPLATAVNYALQPGVTINITELLPEP